MESVDDADSFLSTRLNDGSMEQRNFCFAHREHEAGKTLGASHPNCKRITLNVSLGSPKHRRDNNLHLPTAHACSWLLSRGHRGEYSRDGFNHVARMCKHQGLYMQVYVASRANSRAAVHVQGKVIRGRLCGGIVGLWLEMGRATSQFRANTQQPRTKYVTLLLKYFL
jgi:hypothetical protein